jgi:hypothetical protein
MLEKRFYNLKVTFKEPVLGSQSDKNVASKYMAGKRNGPESIPEDELESLPDEIENKTTVFHRDANGRPCLFDYQVKGMLKNSAKNFSKALGFSGLRSKVVNFVFVNPRRIDLIVPEMREMGHRERPLLADTAQGPRVALARSEELPAGTFFYCTLKVYEAGKITEEVLRDLLAYGEDCGIGQWRTAKWGSFTYELEEDGVEDPSGQAPRALGQALKG